jgi:hypothetical protein
MSAIALSAVMTFFALVMMTKIITGEELIIYYHHEIGVLAATAALVWLLGQPVLPYLDVTILGVGLFLSCGRIGCLMVGCCHGRPHWCGVRYRREHARAGFTPYLVGVRLFPIQAVESLYVLCVVLAGSIFFLSGRAPGEAVAWYVIAYDMGRFCFEFMRGDPERPYLYGFSQPQWISLLLMLAVMCGELSGLLTFHPWHAAATACLTLTMIAISLRRHFHAEDRYQLCGARHLKELAQAVGMLPCAAGERASLTRGHFAPSEARVARTCLGVQISAGRIERGAELINHYALSYRDKVMTEEEAASLSRLIVQLKHSCGRAELIDGQKGIYHLLIHSRAAEQSRPSGLDYRRRLIGVEAHHLLGEK